MTTRFPNGINDHPSGNAGMGRYYPRMDPTRYVQYWNDFHIYTAGDWTVTETQAGATQGINAGAHGGILSLVNSSADNDLNALQLASETFRFDSSKKFWIRTRFKVDDATQSDIMIGLSITDTSPLQSLPTDYIAFYKADDAAALVASVTKNSTSSTIAMGNMSNDTYVVAEMYYDPYQTRLTAMLNGATVGTDLTSVTNIPEDEELAVIIALQNGSAAARTLSVDYLEVLMER